MWPFQVFSVEKTSYEMVCDSREDQELKVVVLHPMQGDWNKWLNQGKQFVFFVSAVELIVFYQKFVPKLRQSFNGGSGFVDFGDTSNQGAF